MADLRNNFIGIKSPNPFWLASAPPTDKAYNVDQVLLAIGQKLDADPLGGAVDVSGGRISVDDSGQTSNPKIWAGGDCTGAGDDLTVTAVAQGRDAAEAINMALRA